MPASIADIRFLPRNILPSATPAADETAFGISRHADEHMRDGTMPAFSLERE